MTEIKVLLRKKIMEEKSIFRNFFLEEDIPEGRYRLRAYTNLMRNADESFFIRDSLLSIRIRNPCLC